MSENDIVADILQRFAERLGADVCPPDLLSSIDQEVRHQWSGVDVYVQGNKTKHRNHLLMADYLKGKPVDQLAAKYAITPRRVRQIVNRKK